MDMIIKTLQQCVIEIQQLLSKSDARKQGGVNATGDEQLSVDVEADKLIVSKLLSLPSVKMIASEEQKDIVKGHEAGEYCIAYDPLDGSSVLESNFSIGSIFGIYRHAFEPQNLVMSAYALYGFNLEWVIAQDSVKHFRHYQGHFECLGELKLHEKGKLNAPGGTQKDWSETHRKLIDGFFAEGYRLRYSGAMVADLHQILKKGGGIFSYPASTNAPNGKLRLLFEVLPFAFIYEKAGGFATDGVNRLLDKPVPHAHATSPCFFGSAYEINKTKESYA